VYLIFNTNDSQRDITTKITKNVEVEITLLFFFNPWKQKKVPWRHQRLSGGSTLSAVYRKLLWDQPSIFPLWSSWRVKFSKKKFRNFMFNSRKKGLKNEVYLTTWYYLVVGSRKLIFISITFYSITQYFCLVEYLFLEPKDIF
jgi:hypothetical protein